MTIRLAGFRDVTRRLTATVGGAFDLPVTLSVDAFDTAVTVTATAVPLEASRSQIASTVSQTEVSLSVNSQRNLSNNFIVDGLSANDDAAG